MSEASELKAFKEKLDRKYGKIAKRRLSKLNKLIAPSLDLMDMNDTEFDDFINQIVAMINQGGNQQQQRPQNNNPNRG